MKNTKTVQALDRTILFSIFALAFFLPISKAIIESFSILAIVCFITKKIIQRKGIPKTHVNFALFAYLVICFVSIFISSNPKITTRTFFSKVMQDITLFLVIAETLNTERRVKNFLCVFFTSSLLLGIDGMYQYSTGFDFIRNRPYREFGSRATATFRSPNGFGCYLATVISLLIPSFFIVRFKALKAALLGLLILLIRCLACTLSKGALFAFLSSAIFLSFWLALVRNIFLIAVSVILIARLFYPKVVNIIIPNFSSVFSNLNANAGIIQRKIMWHTGWLMFLSSPLLGVGLGTFMFNFKRFLVDEYSYGPAYAHNCYLQIAAEIGIIGLACFLAVLFLFFYNGIRILKTSQKNFSWYILLGSLAAMLSYCVQMGVDTTFYALDLGMLFWIILGLGAALMRNIELR